MARAYPKKKSKGSTLKFAEGGMVPDRASKRDSEREQYKKDATRYGGSDLPSGGPNALAFGLSDRRLMDEQPDVETSIRKKSK